MRAKSAPLAAIPRSRCAALDHHGVPPALRAELSDGGLEHALARALRFGTLPAAAPLLFAGPPGAGKTLTVARLAARLTLAGAPPLVVTTDGYRAAAAEQLAAFTRLLGLRLVVASTPRALARALRRRPAGRAVLIDATGCDPFARADLDAASALADAAGAQIAAVLAAGGEPNESAEHAACLAEAGARFLVATKLDLTRRIGGVLAAARAGDLRLTDAGTGPGVANGLTPLTPAFLAERLARQPRGGPDRGDV